MQNSWDHFWCKEKPELIFGVIQHQTVPQKKTDTSVGIKGE